MKYKLIYLFVTGVIASVLSETNLFGGASFIEWMIYSILIWIFMNDKIKPLDK
jgi:hypothetical protein